MDTYQQFIAVSRYARWIPELKRRETWKETVERYLANVVDTSVLECHKDYKELRSTLKVAIEELDVLPSMRALMTAGPALDRDNTCGYNCSYVAIDDFRAFDEAMFILLCGTGVGYSVERQYIDKLPVVPEKLSVCEDSVLVKDSKEGWADAVRTVFTMIYNGAQIPQFDYRLIRPAGARLETFGGRASGPEPLMDCINFIIRTMKESRGRKLNSLECHDIMGWIAKSVVSGGVRRSATISLSNFSDQRMRHCKDGEFWKTNPQRALANNSVAYTEKPDSVNFMREWLSLAESGTGERGIVNRQALKKRAQYIGRAQNEFGVNPCAEIALQSKQFCNLTEVVVRETDNIHYLKYKVRLATILGTIQATNTNFPYLRPEWKHNTQEEALLGVSLTGIMDNEIMSGRDKDYNLRQVLQELRQEARKTNQEYAKKLGINVSKAITTVKPSGTVSQLVDSASGIHPRYSRHYIRTVRGSNTDPVTKLMKDAGVKYEPDAMNPDGTTVFKFPKKSPAGSVLTRDLSAIQHLEIWKTYARYWTEHQPSITVMVRSEEWLEVGSWVYKNFDMVSGISFLPLDDHVYQQAPYQECEIMTYSDLNRDTPSNLDWSKLEQYELEDQTAGSQTLACSGDQCELVDLT